MEEMEDDKEVFLRGICPVCHSRLRVGKADDPYISCRNFKVCKFTASIDLIKYTSCFKDREGNYTVVNLPEYVINDVLELQENANLELSKVENLFPKGICPWCGCSLVIRKGEYGAFLGCTGYADFGCNFKAKLDLGNSTATFQTRYSPKRTIVKPIPEDLVREYNSRKEVPKRMFLIREKDGRED